MDFSLSDSSHWIDAPVVIEEPISRFEISRGYAFGVELDGETVGAVFVADGTWTIRFERPSDARAAANRLAVLEDVPKRELLSVVAEQRLVETFDKGYLLGDELWTQISPHLKPVEMQNNALVEANRGAAEEILVVDVRSLASARRIAEELLRERVEWMRRYSFDPASLIWVNQHQPSELRASLGEFRTGQTWDRFAGETELTPGQRWLTYIRDPSGAFDRERRSQVIAQGLVQEHLVRQPVARERFPEDPGGTSGPPQRVDLETAGVTALWDREGAGVSQRAHVVADIRLRAEGGPAKVVWLDVPHVDQRAFSTSPPLAEGFAFGGVELAGQPLQALQLPLAGDQRDGRGDVRTYAVILPQELPQGQTIDLRVSWADRHRYVHFISQSGREQHAGNTTALLPLLPNVRTHAGKWGALRARVGVRKQYAKSDIPVLSGARVAEVEEGDYRFIETISDTRAAGMALGSWRERYDPATDARPAVRSLLRGPQATLTPAGLVSTARELPGALETVLSGWDPSLPPYPWPEFQLAELHEEFGIEPLWLAGGGLTGIYSFNTPEHFELYTLAMATHAQLWLKQSPINDSTPRAVGSAYGINAVGLHAGPEASAAWYDRLRRGIDSGHKALVGRAAETFLIGRSLCDLVGTDALWEATGRVLSGDFPATREGLQRAAESVTGEDLSGFFEFWFSTSLSPKVTAAVRRGSTRGEVEILLHSDVPFGRFPVPVRIISGAQIRDERIEIIDGEGRLTLTGQAPVDRVEIDPGKSLLLR